MSEGDTHRRPGCFYNAVSQQPFNRAAWWFIVHSQRFDILLELYFMLLQLRRFTQTKTCWSVEMSLQAAAAERIRLINRFDGKWILIICLPFQSHILRFELLECYNSVQYPHWMILHLTVYIQCKQKKLFKSGGGWHCSTLTQEVCNPSVKGPVCLENMSTMMTVSGDLIGGFTHLLCFTSLSV